MNKIPRLLFVPDEPNIAIPPPPQDEDFYNPTKNMSEETKPVVGKVVFGPDIKPGQPHGMMSKPTPITESPSALERAVDANTLAIERLETKAAELNLEIETLRKQVKASMAVVDQAMALVQKIDAKPVTMPNPLPGQTMSDEQVWLTAWSACASCPETSEQNTTTEWADACLRDFKARFRKDIDKSA